MRAFTGSGATRALGHTHLRAVSPADLGTIRHVPYALPGAVGKHRDVAVPRLDIGLAHHHDDRQRRPPLQGGRGRLPTAQDR